LGGGCFLFCGGAGEQKREVGPFLYEGIKEKKGGPKRSRALLPSALHPLSSSFGRRGEGEEEERKVEKVAFLI